MSEDPLACCASPALPQGIIPTPEEYKWERNLVGDSDCAVYRLSRRRGRPDLYLKHGKVRAADDLSDERSRLQWMALHVSVPEIVGFAGDAREAWLAMTALPGKTAYQELVEHPDRGNAIVDLLATFLRQLHEIPAHQCPFDSSHHL